MCCIVVFFKLLLCISQYLLSWKNDPSLTSHTQALSGATCEKYAFQCRIVLLLYLYFILLRYSPRRTYLLSDGGVIGTVCGSAYRRRAEALQPRQLSIVGDVPQVNTGVCKLAGRGLHLWHEDKHQCKHALARPLTLRLPDTHKCK